jgi:hypothetical protein
VRGGLLREIGLAWLILDEGGADASTAHCMLDGAPHKPRKIVLEVAD